MSAFIVGHDHIDALLTFATQRYVYGNVRYRWDDHGATIDEDNATEIGRKLLAENVRSVKYRYPNDTDDELPGTSGEDTESYTFKPWPLTQPLSAVSVLKACDCFDYQACETEDYVQSEAHAIIDAIRKRAIGRLPEYDNAPGWDIRRGEAK